MNDYEQPHMSAYSDENSNSSCWSVWFTADVTIDTTILRGVECLDKLGFQELIH